MQKLREELDRIHAQYVMQANWPKSIALLRALKAGEVQLDQINVTADGWQLVEVKMEEPEPELNAAERRSRNGQLPPVEIEASDA